jgi:hypothetical protein
VLDLVGNRIIGATMDGAHRLLPAFDGEVRARTVRWIVGGALAGTG